ncbi:hypothetical protein [Caulobacter sp. CCG-8]|uniref:hypothetical protein n=1 Tax=Caulobacter sp. CCG-8 TaxID=3127958 RepID=UPI00307EA4A3
MDAALIDRRASALSPGRVARALAAGTFTGSGSLAAVVVVVVSIASLMQGGFEAFWNGVMVAFLFFLFSLPVWAGGLIVVGLPGWAALHALGWRSRWAGAGFGGVATLVVSWMLGLGLNPRLADQPWGLLPMAGVLALIGAVVGWVAAGAAYGSQGADR